ncbi:double-strand-break repair protein rad21 homolog [Stomoxys calcitrans]|uniref:double-strand-break repair protein rad21 homolog n=1 Tax=Stomoxys calcitrans TaxID=35570 RepID=UPI0027E2417E|nr:double-strand-break repair protein rad21 homolog [Stomoxys calcitrans]XP_013109713.2 double-strand-break repair protein rad21 homolog [Stomoxys calcitrans]XP_059222155.1 double-strand-break repair protein rad21 homolog [Stomoxys calcitrans]XP_059222156.1 double-strand-break repair protein rad21 homolog [Stomoxys calcitrans]XP_059222157.1 double-strand-break repair protein rad21 homolog [Stomoxys calcitrans]XP_059222158.1 double-strand-break repair protein rad21 homolog [Stomoxys calcitrans]
MFYAHIILAKKGPLARVWLAAHWDKKITKAHVFETNIEKSVEGIMQPKVKLALRTSGHLLLGVVRIYSRKAKYLLADCNEAFVKIKMAFRPGMVDLPEGHREANVNAITLPEVFHDFDTALPELNDIDIEAQFAMNQSRADEITMREDYGSLSHSLHDDGFGDIGFGSDTPDMVRDHLDSHMNDQLFEDEVMPHMARDGAEASISLQEPSLSNPRLDMDADGFGDEFGQRELFDDELFGDPPRLDEEVQQRLDNLPIIEDSDDDHFDVRAASPASTTPGSPLPTHQHEDDHANLDAPGKPAQAEQVDENLEQSTLLQNEEESFALAPIEASAYKGITKNAKRKRKLIVDEVKNISGEEMKAQLANTSDIVTILDLAPPTKRLMYWKETGGVEKLFSLPSRMIPARVLMFNYNRHLISRFTALEDFSSLGPADMLALDHISNENENDSLAIITKKGRKRKLDAANIDAVPPTAAPAADNTLTQNISLPDQVREQQDMINATAESLRLEVAGAGNDSSIPPAEATIYDNCPRSPNPMFALNDIHNLDNLPSDLGSLHHDLDHEHDFDHVHMTPGNLHHGQMTPHHPEIEAIESIPNLPVDQISSILKEAESMPPQPQAEQLDATLTEEQQQQQQQQQQEQPQQQQTPIATSLASDWNEFPAFPASIEIPPNVQDEQQENETSEQFEERVLNKRAAQMFYAVKNRLVQQECLALSDLTGHNSRKQAAQKFYSLLVLKKFRALNIDQEAPYSDIIITRGTLFDNPKL